MDDSGNLGEHIREKNMLDHDLNEVPDNDSEDTIKDTNPKDSLGIRKVPIHCVSAAVLMEVGLAMMEGGRKYGTHNYRAMGVRASVYYDAGMRHLMDFWEGTDIDPESGVHHISKAIAGLMVLRDSMLMENWVDDRPIRLPNRLGIDRLNAKASEIIDRYPEPKEPYIELNQESKNEKEIDKSWADGCMCVYHNRSIRLCGCEACVTRRIKYGLPEAG
jgi:hypothetical protein